MSAADTNPVASKPHVRQIDMDRPWAWLAAGWKDLWATPSIGLTYGLAFAVGGAALTWFVLSEQVYYLTFPLMAGFLLIGPIVAAGLYEISRRRRLGQPVSLMIALAAMRRNPVQIGLMGVVLLLINLAWTRFAALLFMLHFSDAPPPIDPLGFLEVVIAVESIPFLIIGTLIGAVLAGLVFAVSAVSIPMLVDHPDIHVFQAIIASWTAVSKNRGAMLLWAWLIVLFIGVGIATAFIGLIVTLPLIGHATWAAYSDAVEWGSTE